MSSVAPLEFFGVKVADLEWLVAVTAHRAPDLVYFILAYPIDPSIKRIYITDPDGIGGWVSAAAVAGRDPMIGRRPLNDADCSTLLAEASKQGSIYHPTYTYEPFDPARIKEPNWEW